MVYNKTNKLSERITMKDRIIRTKQYLVSHQNDIVVGAASLIVGVTIGKSLVHKHTILRITPEGMAELVDENTVTATWNIAKRNSIHLVKVPTPSS
jgi:hypothetical protein